MINQTIRQTLRIYLRFWQVNWAEQWQYRANLMMYLLYWLVSPVVYMAVWTTIATSQGSVGGLTAADFIRYYMTLLIVDQLTTEISIHVFAYKIQDGSLSNELIRPVHFVLTSVLMYNLAFKALTFIALLPVWTVLFLLFQPNFSTVSPLGLLLAVPACLVGFGINFLLGAAITSMAFWTTRVYSLSEFYYAVVVLFSGQFVPLELMPGFVKTIAPFLPFQMFKYFPIQLILGKLDQAQIVQGFVSGGVWLIVSFFLFRLVWKRGLSKFSAVGA